MPETNMQDSFLSELDSLTTRLRSLHTSHALQQERISGLEQENAELHRTINELSKCVLVIQNAAKTSLEALNGRLIPQGSLNGHGRTDPLPPRAEPPLAAPEQAA
jgi:uncharacterized coiled-coil protein SlyX